MSPQSGGDGDEWSNAMARLKEVRGMVNHDHNRDQQSSDGRACQIKCVFN
jgi:hypothetical protein